MKNNKVSMVDLIDRAQHIKTESGFWSDSWHKWDINYSSILTLLIKEAAKCKRYSSDLFIDWRSIDQSLTDLDFQGDMWAFGFRQDGVDCLTFIESRLDSEGVNAYDSIYLLWVYPDNDPEFPSMTMELCKAY